MNDNDDDIDDVDIVDRSDELDQRILAIPSDRVFTKNTVVVGFVIIMLALAAGFTYMYFSLRSITTSTNQAVKNEISVLQERVIEQDETILVQEDLIRQATDAIVLLSGILIDNGITPPEIVIRPQEESGG